MSRGIDDHEGKKYLRLIYSAHPENTRLPISVDVYAVLEAFGVTCPARAHCIKKLLACGNRGKGSELNDLIGADAALSRAIELQRQRDQAKQERKEEFTDKEEKQILEDREEGFRSHCINCGCYTTHCLCERS